MSFSEATMKFEACVFLLALRTTTGLVDSASYISAPVSEGLQELRAKPVNSTRWDMHQYDVDVPGQDDITVYGYPRPQDVHVSGSLGDWESWEGGLVSKYCNTLKKAIESGSSANFLDVGANIGAVTLPVAACIRHHGKVFAVEGMPSIADHLKAGILANSLENVVLYDYAVSDPSAGDSLKMALNPTNKGGSTVKGNKAWSNYSSTSVFTAKVTTLDSMLHQSPDMQRLRLAKMDIEGSEGLALKGGRELFTNYPPCTLVVELVGDWLARAGTSAFEVLGMLDGFGYDTSPVPYGAQGHGTYTLVQKNMPGCLARLGSGVQALLRGTKKGQAALQMK
jgi:FkbM family methyltransferase